MDQSIILLLIGLMTLLLLITISMLVIYSGIFSDVTVGVGKSPISDVVVYYKFGTGSYRDIFGSGYIFTEVTSIAPKLKCFGVYYDNPDKVPNDKLRWAVGVIVRESNSEIDPAIADKLRTEGYKEFNFPKVENVVKADFPCKTQISVLLGMYKVYPSLEYYVKEKKLCAHPWLEIYDGDTVHFMAPLSKQESFYVPESKLQSTEEKDKSKKAIKLPVTRIKHSFSVTPEEENLVTDNDMIQLKTNRKEVCDHTDLVKREQCNDTSSGGKSAEGCETNGSKNLTDLKSTTSDPRSKSVSVLLSKTSAVKSENLRSKSLSTGEKHSKSLLFKDNKADSNNLCDSDTPVGDFSGLESLDPNCSMESSTSSINSTAETTASSYYSSEYSYNSETSQNTATFTELSSDSDNGDGVICDHGDREKVQSKVNSRNKTPEH